MGKIARKLSAFWLTLAIIAIAPAALAFAADASSSVGTLIVQVYGVSPKGIVRLGLYTKDSYPNDKADPVVGADVPATGGVTTITLSNVEPGEYAIETYQDLNANGKMDTSLLGLPEEPYGFSRDARPRLSKPAFERVKFAIAAGMNTQAVHLQNTTTVVASNSFGN